MAADKAGKGSPPPSGGGQSAAQMVSETASSNDQDESLSSQAASQGGESSQNHFSMHCSEEFPEGYSRPEAKSLCFEVYLCAAVRHLVAKSGIEKTLRRMHLISFKLTMKRPTSAHSAVDPSKRITMWYVRNVSCSNEGESGCVRFLDHY